MGVVVGRAVSVAVAAGVAVADRVAVGSIVGVAADATMAPGTINSCPILKTELVDMPFSAAMSSESTW